MGQTNYMVVEPLIPLPQYSCYAELITSGIQHVDASIFTDMEVLDLHFNQILNILKDGIEKPQIHNAVLFVHFVDFEVVKLSIFDYWFNLIFWGLPVATNHPITSQYLYYYEDITQDNIAEYINTNFIKINRHNYTNLQINNIIDDIMYKFQFIDKFSLYLYNTANNEDTIALMKTDKVFWDCVHCDLTGVPIEDIKDEGMNYTKKGIDRMIASGTHWAIPYFKAKEGINIKQLREFMFNIGTRPNNDGGVYPRATNGNYSNRGITDPIDYMMDADNARKAQRLTHHNVSESGAFARILGLNNMDDILFPDPNYVCDSKHFVQITITNQKMLSMYKNRYFRFVENGAEYKISQEPLKDNLDLIGKTILVRSPITCASRTRGMGICHRCYGDLAKTNWDINIGKIAAEILSSILTQRMLSAKHLLESNIKKIQWCNEFNFFFNVSFNAIKLKDEDVDFKKYKLVINPDSIDDDDEDENSEGSDYNNYVSSFTVIDPKGNEFLIKTLDDDNLYLSIELDQIIKRMSPDELGNYYIQMELLKDKNLFFIEVSNNELGQSLAKIQNIINKNSEVAKLKTKDAMTQELVNAIIEGGINIDAIHLEVLLAHQCVSAESNLLDPEWQYPNAEYRMVSLNERLRDNPSVTISLMYKNIGKQLYYPLTFEKTAPSVIDLFYMDKPQNFMSMEPVESNIKSDKEVGPIKPFTYEQKYVEEDDEEE